jgi:HEAT repeat protein
MLWWRMRQLRSRSAATRMKALGRIDRSAPRQLIEAVVDLLGDLEEMVAAQAADALVRVGDLSLEPLFRVLQPTSGIDVQMRAIDVVSRLRSSSATSVLLSMIHDPELKIANCAVRGLGYPGNVQAVEPLMQLISCGRRQAKRKAALALGEIGDRRAVDVLIAWITNSKADLLASDVHAVAAVLSVFGDRRATLPLCALLNHFLDMMPEERSPRSDSNSRLITPLVKALASLEDGSASHVMARALTTRQGKSGYYPADGDIVEAFLNRHGSAQAIQPLAEMLCATHGNNPSDYYCRRAAARILAKIGDPSAIRAIVSCARNNPRISGEMISALTTVLRRHASATSLDDLILVRDLPGVQVEVWSDGPDDFGPVITKEYVDCSEVRHLAMQELSRRVR